MFEKYMHSHVCVSPGLSTLALHSCTSNDSMMDWDDERINAKVRHLANRLSALTAATAAPLLERADKRPALSKDYLQLSAQYKRQERYRSSSSFGESLCIACERGVTKALYPCQHCSLCDACILRQRIRPGHSRCPLCGETVQLILKNQGGMERQLYEDWLVDGMAATLSSSFIRQFQSKSLVEIRWATVVDNASTVRTARPKPKVAKVTQILPTLVEERPSSEDDDDEVSSYLSLQPERMYRSNKGTSCTVL